MIAHGREDAWRRGVCGSHPSEVADFRASTGLHPAQFQPDAVGTGRKQAKEGKANATDVNGVLIALRVELASSGIRTPHEGPVSDFGIPKDWWFDHRTAPPWRRAAVFAKIARGGLKTTHTTIFIEECQ